MNKTLQSHRLPSLLSAADFAAETTLAKRTFYELARTGRLRTVRVGRRVLLERAEFERFIAHHRNEVEQ